MSVASKFPSDRSGQNSIPRNVTEAGSNDNPRLLQAMNEYMTAVDAGHRPNRRDLLARYPEIATELSACLQGAAFFTSAAARLNNESGGSLNRPATDVGFSTAEPLGDFRLIREIGRGGMGVVYEALQLSLGRRVALKVLPFANALDTRHLQRFRNEAQAAAQLHHTNIVPVYAVGCERSVHFYAMQLIDGQSLDEIIRELKTLRSGAAPQQVLEQRSRRSNAASSINHTEYLEDKVTSEASATPNVTGGDSVDLVGTASSGTGSVSLLHSVKPSSYFRTVANLGLQAADALDYAHQVGVVHRDIKPANLLLDERGTLWITDFGLAQSFASSNLTRTGDLLGTLRYMSPEQASGRAAILDQRTDVYSLGVTIYELLTLERAVTGQSREELLYQLDNVDPVPARGHDHTIPRELDVIVSKAISKDAADRYSSAGELAADLRRFLNDVPIAARPPSLWDRGIKWTRRHRPIVHSVLAILPLATVGLIVSNLLISREQKKTEAALLATRHEAAEANRQRERAANNFLEARKAVDFFTEFVSQDLPTSPQLDIPRREMLEESLYYYQKFLNDHQADPSTNANFAAAQTKIFAILRSLAAGEGLSRLLACNRLLSESSVQDDLAMTREQRNRAQNLRLNFPQPRHTAAGSSIKADSFEAEINSFRDQLTALLQPPQLKRLDEISRQVRGVWAFNDADVSSVLKLTFEQKRQIRRIRMIARGRENDPQEVHNVSTVQPLINQVLAILSPMQRDAWKTLLGEPFNGVTLHPSATIFLGSGGSIPFFSSALNASAMVLVGSRPRSFSVL